MVHKCKRRPRGVSQSAAVRPVGSLRPLPVARFPLRHRCRRGFSGDFRAFWHGPGFIYLQVTLFIYIYLCKTYTYYTNGYKYYPQYLKREKQEAKTLGSVSGLRDKSCLARGGASLPARASSRRSPPPHPGYLKDALCFFHRTFSSVTLLPESLRFACWLLLSSKGGRGDLRSCWRGGYLGIQETWGESKSQTRKGLKACPQPASSPPPSCAHGYAPTHPWLCY